MNFSKIFAFFALLVMNAHTAKNPTTGKTAIHKMKVKKINGKELSLSQMKNKVLLISNIASRCGYTFQLTGLEKLHQDYQKKGLVVIGVPSNDFGSQTPETNEKMAEFCKVNYGVSFPLLSKTPVSGKKKHPLFAQLIKIDGKEIQWNFEKFLVDKKGKVVKRFSSSISPTGKEITSEIEKLLK